MRDKDRLRGTPGTRRTLEVRAGARRTELLGLLALLLGSKEHWLTPVDSDC